MKNINLYKLNLLTVFVTLVFSSCSEDSEDEDLLENTPYLNVSTTSINAKGVVPFTEEFDIKSNQQWEITEKPSWVNLDITEGKNDRTVTLNISSSEKNYRTGNVEIKTIDGNYSAVVEVKQNGNALSAVTGDYLSSIVTSGAFRGTDNRQYMYKHEIKVEFFINGSHLASDYGVTGSTIQGFLLDGAHTTTVILLSNRERTTFSYRAFATNKSTGKKVYGEERTIISAAN